MKKTKQQQKRKTKEKRLVGKGDYSMTTNEYNSLVSKLDKIDGKIPSVKSFAGNVGGAIGGAFGKPALGRSLAEKASAILGFGDYTIQTNSLMKGYDGSGILPKFHSTSNGVRIREREFLGDIVSSATAGAFKNTNFPITPTDSSTFPWLSNIARLYDQWEPNGIVFEFVSTSSDFNGSAQALGSLIMATDYDCMDSPFPNKVIMDNADYSNSGKPSISQVHGIECDPAQRPYKLMYTKGITGEVANRNTLGNFQVASAGVSAANVVLGELWVSYDITFYKKQIISDWLPTYNITGTYTAGGTYSSLVPNVNLSGFTYTVPAAAQNQLHVTFPQSIVTGRYLIMGLWSVPVGVTNNGFLIPTYGYTPGYASRASGSEAGKPVMCAMIIDVNAPGPQFMIYNGGVSTTFTLSVTQVTASYQF